MNAESSQQNAFIAGVVANLKQRRRALIISAVVLVLYALTGFFVAPWVLKGVMQDTVSEQYNATLDIERLRVNPFVLSVEVSGLKLHDPDGAPHVGWQTLYVNFQLSSIFRRAWTFHEIRLNGANIDVTRQAGGGFNFDYLVPPPGPEPEPEVDKSAPPRVLVRDFNIENASLRWHDQAATEPVDTTFGPVDVRIADLNTLPQRPGQQAVTITTDTNGTLSWQGDLQLNPLRSRATATVTGSHFPLLFAYLRHETGFDVTEGDIDINLDYEVDTAADGELSVSVDNFDLTISDARVRTFTGGQGGGDVDVLRLPSVELANGRLRWPDQSVHLESLAVAQPYVSLFRDAEGRLSIARDAGDNETESEASSDPPPPESPWRFSLDEFRIDRLGFSFQDDALDSPATTEIEAISLQLLDISNVPDASFPTTLMVNTGDGGTINVQGEVGLLPAPVFNLDVGIEALQLAPARPYLQEFADISLDSGALGVTAAVSSNSDDPLRLEADIRVNDFELTETETGSRLGSWSLLDINRLQFSETANTLEISEIAFSEAYADVLISADGSVNIGRANKEREQQEVTDAPSSEAPAITVGRIRLIDSGADFADESLPLPFAARIAELNGELSTISTLSSEASRADFEGKVDEYGLVRIEGTVTPLEPSRQTDIKVIFRNVDVPKFTAYSIPFAGREIASGSLDLDLGYKVEQSSLLGENKIVLRDFELGEEVPHPGAMSLPLGLAVALLKDREGNIDIDLPVRGNVDDPEFSYGGVIMKALGNLIVKIVTSPFALLGNLVGVEADQLEYVYFPAGRSDLTPPEIQKAEKIAEALTLRPQLALNVQGVATETEDSLALREAALDAQIDALLNESAENDASFSERRRRALETLLVDTDPASDLTALQATYTATPEGGEGEAVLDEIAYTDAIYESLVKTTVLPEAALATLAAERAANLVSVIQAADPELVSRTSIESVQQSVSMRDEGVPMKITLEASRSN